MRVCVNENMDGSRCSSHRWCVRVYIETYIYGLYMCLVSFTAGPKNIDFHFNRDLRLF